LRCMQLQRMNGPHDLDHPGEMENCLGPAEGFWGAEEQKVGGKWFSVGKIGRKIPFISLKADLGERGISRCRWCFGQGGGLRRWQGTKDWLGGKA